MKRVLIVGLISGFLCLLTDSCASSRKCDGRKAIKTPMGKM
jgi:hypothetical protein